MGKRAHVLSPVSRHLSTPHPALSRTSAHVTGPPYHAVRRRGALARSRDSDYVGAGSAGSMASAQGWEWSGQQAGDSGTASPMATPVHGKMGDILG